MTKHLSWLKLLGFLLLSCSVSVYSQNGSANEIQNGYELLKGERFDSAISVFSNVLRADPDSYQARLGLAIALVGVDKYSDASREIAKLLARTPNDARLLELAAQTFWQQKRLSEAETVLKRRLNMGNERPDIWSLYGDVLDAQKRTIEAVSAYEKAVSLDPNSIDLRYALGSLYWKRIRYDDAEREFLEVLRRQPNEPRSSFNLGDIYLSKGDASKALPYLETAVRAFPDEYDTRLALGKADLATNKFAEAIEQLQAAIKLRPDIAEGHYQLALSLQKAGRRDEAKAEFKTTQELQKAKRESETVPIPKQNQ